MDLLRNGGQVLDFKDDSGVMSVLYDLIRTGLGGIVGPMQVAASPHASDPEHLATLNWLHAALKSFLDNILITKGLNWVTFFQFLSQTLTQYHVYRNPLVQQYFSIWQTWSATQFMVVLMKLLYPSLPVTLGTGTYDNEIPQLIRLIALVPQSITWALHNSKIMSHVLPQFWYLLSRVLSRASFTHQVRQTLLLRQPRQAEEEEEKGESMAQTVLAQLDTSNQAGWQVMLADLRLLVHVWHCEEHKEEEEAAQIGQTYTYGITRPPCGLT